MGAETVAEAEMVMVEAAEMVGMKEGANQCFEV